MPSLDLVRVLFLMHHLRTDTCETLRDIGMWTEESLILLGRW